MKKIIALVLVLCMVLALVACSSKPASTTTPAPTTTEEKKDEQIVLKLWCIATESDANRPAYLKAIEEYEAANPGIKIEMEAFENES